MTWSPVPAEAWEFLRMGPVISGCLQGGAGEVGLALSHSGEGQELSAGRKMDSQRHSGVRRGFAFLPMEIPWAP